ncbi:MAG: alpha/beta hydrolase-fold protein [Pirellulaceae bacterium]
MPATAQDSDAPLFSISVGAGLADEPLDGRLLLMLSTDADNEPRFQISDRFDSQQIFGVDVEDWSADESRQFDQRVFGFPARSLANVPAGKYRVQALLHKYETFDRSDGHTVKLPMDRGEGQQWNRAPGNLYSTPVEVDFDPAATEPIQITLDQVIPAIEPPADTEYIKHIRIQSKLLSDFWGRPMHLGAHVLLPEGFHENPDARYPLVIMHGHFPSDFRGFRPEPPDPDLEPEYSARFNLEGYNRVVQQEAHDFYKLWTGPDFPRVLLVEIQHPNPYYDDSYAVNSANLGPYGDAITHELVPEIERQFRGIGEGWARCLYGGSTGGWEALAAQVFYPDDYNACYAACPDPIDFRAYTVVNIYEDDNAYFEKGHFGYVARPGRRNYLGHISSTLEQMNHLELVLGTRGRSGQQWDIWQAVYSPCGDDGYPKPIWDKVGGDIDREVAEFWRENYDLTHILQRDWATLGPKLEGKIHIYVGDMDNYYLNNAVYLTERFLNSTSNPEYGGEVDYGDRQEHCWNGDHNEPNAISRLRYHRMFIPRFVERILKSAPPDADLESWRY